MARWLIFPLLAAELKSIINMMKDKSAPKRYKAVVILGLIYLFSPVDLIPAPVLGLSIIDDISIWGAILSYLHKPLSAYKDEKINPKSRKYKGKTVVDVEDYVIKDEDKEMRENDE
ncbi:MAG: hypothetical protein IJC41_02740 [Firmicutes bacterium]|nr:hypothetical protein [Clostridiales bacterium]MBQ4339897.1 hypothetical protein [Bacillota bacterium]